MFLANLVVFPLLLFCGVNVPLDELPGWMEAIGRSLPLTHGIEAAREVAAGAPLGDVAHLLWTEAAIGAAYAPSPTRCSASSRPRAGDARRSRRSSIRHMCRNIQTLFNFEPPATEDEVRAASLQYVRKISGFTKPSQANEQAFERAIDEVTEASMRLLGELVTTAAPKDREVEAARRRARAEKRFAAA